MTRIHVVPAEKTHAGSVPYDLAGQASSRSYVAADTFPLRLDECSLADGASLTIGPSETEVVAYVWHGEAQAGGHRLAAGSSLIVERGARASVAGQGEGCELLVFSASTPPDHPSSGGHVHILPTERVPRDDMPGEGDVSGGMHADSQCPTCDVWLHENGFPGSQPKSPEEQASGIHSHSEDEIIFVVEGDIRLGRKLFPAGTAIAIPADTLYSFTPGPDGLRFINFRAARPSEIRFASGDTMDEIGYWREKLPRPDYLAPS